MWLVLGSWWRFLPVAARFSGVGRVENVRRKRLPHWVNWLDSPRGAG